MPKKAQGKLEEDGMQKTVDTMGNPNIKAITKARKFESTKKGLIFYITPLLFRVFLLSSFRDGFLGFHSVFWLRSSVFFVFLIPGHFSKETH
jgi:hypothetical protein